MKETSLKELSIFSYRNKRYEPRCEKTGRRGFRPGPTQTGLYSHRICLFMLEISDLVSRGIVLKLRSELLKNRFVSHTI